MNRLTKKWQDLRRAREKALVTFITAGDPNLQKTGAFVLSLEKAGADIIELGIPFSDPMADGPVIQRASERALANGTRLRGILGLVRKLRRKTNIPLLLMGYYNPILHYGLQKFSQEAAVVGVDAVLVVDLPPEESADLDRELKKQDIALIYLLTPTSDMKRIRKVVSRARGFIYFVSMTGITGAKLKSEEVIWKKVLEIRRLTRLPIAVGFGISTPEQARKIAKLADGVVVGSALVKKIEGKIPIGQLEKFVAQMKAALEIRP